MQNGVSVDALWFWFRNCHTGSVYFCDKEIDLRAKNRIGANSELKVEGRIFFFEKTYARVLFNKLGE